MVYLLVQVYSNHFYCVFLFCRAAVRAVSLVRPVPVFLHIVVLSGLLWNK